MANEEILDRVRGAQQHMLEQILSGQLLMIDTMRERLDRIEARQDMSEEPLSTPDPNVGHE